MAYSYERTAANQLLSTSDLTKIKKLVEHNDHIGAYLLGAKTLGAKPLAKKIELCVELIKLEGHNPFAKYTHELYQEMMRFAKQELDADDYQAFYAAF